MKGIREMKILHITQTLPGGPASYLLELIPAQIDDFGTANVKVIAPACQIRHINSLPKETLIGYQGHGRAAWHLLRLLITALQTIRHYNPEIVHLHSTFAGAVVRACYLFRERRPKIIYCAHGWAFTMSRNNMQHYIYALIERTLAKATDVIINISHSEHLAAIKAGIPPNKMVVVHNGVDPKPILPNMTVHMDRSKLNLLFVGRLDRQKGLDLLIKAMSDLQAHPVHLHVVGDHIVDTNRRGQISRASNITYYGWRPRAELAAYIEAADATIMPSRWEGFGLVAIETMRCGRPVLASDVGGLSELVIDGISGIRFPTEDIGAITAMIRGLERPNLEAMGKTAREWFLENFTSKMMNDEVRKIYAELRQVLEEERMRVPRNTNITEEPRLAAQ